VVASTATTIGVELSPGQGTQGISGVLGYRRAEFAYVPTNRRNEVSPDGKPLPGSGAGVSTAYVNNGGARDSANVVMELQYGGIFTPDGRIYQRLAVGEIAVRENSAAVLFAKDSAGNLVPDALAAAAGMEAASARGKASLVIDCVSAAGGAIDNAKLKKLIAAASLDTKAKAAIESHAPALARFSTADEMTRYLVFFGDLLEPLTAARSDLICRN